MPKLYKYIGKEGYYIKGAIPGSGQNSTLQVTPEALRRIRAVIGEKEGSFPHYVLRELLDEKLVFTKGLYPLGRIPIINVLRSTDQVDRKSTSRLIFIEEDNTWKLAIQITELPRTWVEKADNLVNALSGWRLHVEGGLPIPATQLWPGRGGAQMSIRPHREPYSVQPVGRWPESWDVVGWLGSVPGLDSGVTLFSGEDGERIESGGMIDLGEAYFLVSPIDTSGRRHLTPPSFLTPESLGRRDSWNAWAIQMPQSADSGASEWCNTIGYRLAQPRYRITLISPPHRYSEQGLPVVLADREIVFGLAPVGSFIGPDAETSFHTTRFQEPGLYRVALDDTSTGPLNLAVELKPVALAEGPAALAIEYGGVRFHALKDGVGPHTIQMRQEWLSEPPTIVVRCAVPLHLSWKLGTTQGRIDQMVAEETDIRAQIAEAIRRRERLTVQLDAGAYGRLHLEYVVQATKTVGDLHLSPRAVQRARWLSAILQGHQRKDALVPLSVSARRKLMRLSALPGCAALRGLQAAPASLIPHLYALMRLVQA